MPRIIRGAMSTKILPYVMVGVFVAQMIALDFAPLPPVAQAIFFISMVAQWVAVTIIAQERRPELFASLKAQWESDGAVAYFFKLPWYAWHLLKMAFGGEHVG